MTSALEAVFSAAAKLKPEDQERFAAWMLAELAAEQRWQMLFTASNDILDVLADEALREFQADNTSPLE